MSVNLQGKINSAKHLIAAIAWICFFLYSVYYLFDSIINSRPYLIFHIIVPFALLLVSIRSVRRYIWIIRNNKKYKKEGG